MMYLKSFSIQDVKCFEHIDLNFLHEDGSTKQWCVILGENGTGKSTLLQAIGLALMGPDTGNRLGRLDGWVREGYARGSVSAEVIGGKGDQLVQKGRSRGKPYKAAYAIAGKQEVSIGGVIYDRPTLVFEGTKLQLNSLKRGVLSEKSLGWFSAGYGPFRRLRGGSVDATRLMYPGGKEARFVTLFREDAALEDLDEWLVKLDHRSRLETDDGRRAERVKQSVGHVIDRLLPRGVELARIDADGALFNTPYRRGTPMNDLSDGYRSMLALVADLLRRLEESYERVEDWMNDEGGVIAEGVVLIDELDAHLHPIWQRQVGFWLQEQFPNLQFIVTTHSPFVPQAADANAVWVLRADTFVPNVVRSFQDQPSVRGWRVDQILNVLFNLSELRDPETEVKMRRHAELSAKRSIGMLDLAESRELSDLSDWLSTNLSAPGDNLVEMNRYSAIQKQVNAFLADYQEKC